MANKFIQVGQLGKSFGVEGFNRIRIFEEFISVVKKETFLFLEEEDYQVPYRVKSWQKTNKMLRFEDINDQIQADLIQNKKIYLERNKVAHLQKNELIGLEGFVIYDGDVEIGEILNLQELPHQLLATLIYNENEIFLPIVEDLVEQIDTENQIIYMSLPDGILSL